MLEPADEYLHDPGDAETFNESMYFNFFDHGRRCGGFVRMGNRPNEGHCEVTFTFYLGDGRVLFNFLRAPIDGNAAFDAGGMRFEVVEPFKRLKAAYQGTAVELRNPHDMMDPKAAFANNKICEIDLELDIEGASPMFGGRRAEAEQQEDEFARNHYEQHLRAGGWMTYDGFEVPLDAWGIRDHSWGPRTWQAPAYYRWLNGLLDDNFGFMASHVQLRSGKAVKGGYVFRDGKNHLVTDVALETTFTGDEHFQDAISAGLTLESGETLKLVGSVRRLLPLRNRRGDNETRITEGFTHWECAGRAGYGISEYLDQMEAGVPSGFAAGV